MQEESTGAESGPGISVWDNSAAAGSANSGPYGDAESRSFYEDLPDLLTMVPLTALGLTSEQAAALRETWKSEKDRQMFDSTASTDTALSPSNNDEELLKAYENVAGEDAESVAPKAESAVSEGEESTQVFI